MSTDAFLGWLIIILVAFTGFSVFLCKKAKRDSRRHVINHELYATYGTKKAVELLCTNLPCEYLFTDGEKAALESYLEAYYSALFRKDLTGKKYISGSEAVKIEQDIDECYKVYELKKATEAKKEAETKESKEFKKAKKAKDTDKVKEIKKARRLRKLETSLFRMETYEGEPLLKDPARYFAATFFGWSKSDAAKKKLAKIVAKRRYGLKNEPDATEILYDKLMIATQKIKVNAHLIQGDERDTSYKLDLNQRMHE